MAKAKEKPSVNKAEDVNGAGPGTAKKHSITPVRKISPKTICPDIKAIARALSEDEPGPIFVGRVLAMVRSAETVSTSYGDSTKFKGEFRAFDADGKEFISSSAYFPEVIADELLNGLSAREDDNDTIEFACDLFIRWNDTQVGYQYEVQVHTEARSSEPLAALAASLPALPSPAAE